MHSPRPFSKFLLLFAILPLLPGCLAYDLFMIHKTRTDRFGSGGPYARLIHAQLHSDNEPGTTVFFTGKLPVSLANLEDQRIRPKAWAERQPVSLIFGGIKDDRMCFQSVYGEEVGDDGAGEQNRVNDLFHSFDLAAEFSGPENSPEVQKRGHVFPKANFSKLDQIELLEQKTVKKHGRMYLINTYQVCGKGLPAPKQPPAYLTVAVAPHNTGDDRDPYLLVWQLFTL